MFSFIPKSGSCFTCYAQTEGYCNRRGMNHRNIITFTSRNCASMARNSSSRHTFHSADVTCMASRSYSRNKRGVDHRPVTCRVLTHAFGRKAFFYLQLTVNSPVCSCFTQVPCDHRPPIHSYTAQLLPILILVHSTFSLPIQQKQPEKLQHIISSGPIRPPPLPPRTGVRLFLCKRQ
jgi:hypothetical protein